MTDARNRFQGSPAQNAGAANPAQGCKVVAALDDANDLPDAGCLYFSAAGTVKVTTQNGDTPTIPVSANMVLPLMVKRVWNAGTTVLASTIFVLYTP